MRALSMRQPYAELILRGIKDDRVSVTPDADHWRAVLHSPGLARGHTVDLQPADQRSPPAEPGAMGLGRIGRRLLHVGEDRDHSRWNRDGFTEQDRDHRSRLYGRSLGV